MQSYQLMDTPDSATPASVAQSPANSAQYDRLSSSHDLMLDPWSGKPLHLADPMMSGGEDRSVRSADNGSGSVKTDPNHQPELRRFVVLEGGVLTTKVVDTTSDSTRERNADPMERTTSPMPFVSGRVMPKWNDSDFQSPVPTDGEGPVRPSRRVQFGVQIDDLSAVEPE
jgi:hypothetical protein